MKVCEHMDGSHCRVVRVPWERLGRFNNRFAVDKSSYDGRFTSRLGRGYCTTSRPGVIMFYTFTEWPKPGEKVNLCAGNNQQSGGQMKVELPGELNRTMTREEFERWLALQLALGWTVRNPEAVEKVRADFRAGATVAPFRLVEGPKS